MANNEILCEYRTYSNRSDSHEHNFTQLILPIDGALSIQTETHKLEVDENHLFYLPPSCKHEFYANSTNKFLVVDIPDKMTVLSSMLKQTDGIHREMDDRWKAIRVLLQHETNNPRGMRNNDQILNLLNYALGFLNENTLPKSIQFINNNLDKSLTIDKLAAIEHFNPTYYNDWFKKQVGVSPNVYIQKLRMDKAKQILKETDVSIQDLSFMLGYENQSSLSRVFKKVVGMSPLQYRKRYRS